MALNFFIQVKSFISTTSRWHICGGKLFLISAWDVPGSTLYTQFMLNWGCHSYKTFMRFAPGALHAHIHQVWNTCRIFQHLLRRALFWQFSKVDCTLTVRLSLWLVVNIKWVSEMSSLHETYMEIFLSKRSIYWFFSNMHHDQLQLETYKWTFNKRPSIADCHGLRAISSVNLLIKIQTEWQTHAYIILLPADSIGALVKSQSCGRIVLAGECIWQRSQ